MAAKKPAPPRRETLPLPEPARLDRAFQRLDKERALNTLVGGGVPNRLLRRLLKDSMPARQASEMPAETWASLAVGIAFDSEVFRDALGQALHDHLAWDREPADMEGWWQAVRERPLEALWMAAISETKPVRQEFSHVASHCVDNYRASPECAPPSWQYVDGLLDVQAATARELRAAEKRAEEAEKRAESDRQRLEELREELKRLRRETAELRAALAEARRQAERAPAVAPAAPAGNEAQRIEELERRLRKADKEREHLIRELERRGSEGREERRADEGETEAGQPRPEPDAASDSTREDEADAATAAAIAADANPRRRVLRQLLRKLLSKGKVGGSHTHEDNVYRGIADHEKGMAKAAVEALYLEGYLVPKPTATDPHVSLSPERVAEVKAIIAGELTQPRLLRFVEG